jgi:hypothetical protein
VLASRYLLQQGYAEEGEITILTPYVGQLLKLRQAVEAVAGLRFVMSDKDLDDLEKITGGIDDAALPTATSEEQSEGALSGTSEQPGSAAAASRTSGVMGGPDASSTSTSNVLTNYATKVTTLKQSIRLATIDNFQVGAVCFACGARMCSCLYKWQCVAIAVCRLWDCTMHKTKHTKHLQ